MKIAYCLSGQPRGIKIASEYVKRNLLEKHDVDVFCHSWYSNSYNAPALIQQTYPNAIKQFGNQVMSNKNEINSRYPNTPNIEKWPPFNTISGFISMFQSFYMMLDWTYRHNIQYDFVIRSRYDYALNRELPFNLMQPGCIYIPHCRMTPARDFGNDQFAVGDMKVMTQYMSTYLYLNQFYDEGVQMIGEDMMAANLKRAGLVGDKLFYIDMNNPFPPGPYNGSPHSLVREDMEQWQKS